MAMRITSFQVLARNSHALRATAATPAPLADLERASL